MLADVSKLHIPLFSFSRKAAEGNDAPVLRNVSRKNPSAKDSDGFASPSSGAVCPQRNKGTHGFEKCS